MALSEWGGCDRWCVARIQVVQTGSSAAGALKGVSAMKINVEVDCTPEEARRAIGLPDLTPIHDKYVQALMGAMDGNMVKPELLETMMKSWMPMGDAGMQFWRKMFEGGKSE
jgi:hypothetical protein